MEQPEWNTVARLNVILICVRACVCVYMCVWQAVWHGAWGDVIIPYFCTCVSRGPSPRRHVLDDAVTSTACAVTDTDTDTKFRRVCKHFRDWRINSSIESHHYLSYCPPLNVILGLEIGTEHLVTKMYMSPCCPHTKGQLQFISTLLLLCCFIHSLLATIPLWILRARVLNKAQKVQSDDLSHVTRKTTMVQWSRKSVHELWWKYTADSLPEYSCLLAHVTSLWWWCIKIKMQPIFCECVFESVFAWV